MVYKTQPIATDNSTMAMTRAIVISSLPHTKQNKPHSFQ
jgi:hypothetical protein